MVTGQGTQQGEQLHSQQASQNGHNLLKRSRALPHCVNCDIEIAWTPTIADSQPYCCPGCAQGGPCSCDYSYDYSQHSDPDALA